MSRKGGPVSFASKGRFDVLGDDGANEPDVEEDDYEEPQDSTSAPVIDKVNSLSKSARKKLAKLTKGLGSSSTSDDKTSTDQSLGANGAQETPKISEDVSTIAESRSGAKSAQSGSLESPNTVQTSEIKPKAATEEKKEVSEPSLSPSTKRSSVRSQTPPNLTSDLPPRSSSLQAPQVESPSLPVPVASTSSQPIPPTSKFSPSLPSSLPLPTGNSLPENRKRKAPQEFSPTGHGSPSKLGVKFQDGIAPGEGKEHEKTIPVQPPPTKKNQNAIERTIWTFIMIGGFIALLCMGHPYMILLVLLCQTLVYKEVTALFELRDKGAPKRDPEAGDRWSKTLNWYFFVVANYFLYGESIIYYFKHIVFVDAYFIPFARNHRFISFMLYVVGFVGFVANLQRQYLRQQFGLFCWVHISLLLIVVSSHFIVNNILEGHVWFFVPASLVICNDVMAYVCGKLFGRTPLFKLSPKKTMEGFIGAFICTLIFGIAWGTFWMRFPYMICPARDLGTNVFSAVSCKPNPVFVWRDFEFTGPLRQILQTILGHAPPAIPYAPFQIHCLVMATFASLVAPFGGFFASGFKRAFDIKDFGHSIPGHGGMTDRMDCQFMMGLFSYVYYSSLIRIQNVTVGSIMQTVVVSLTLGEQLELLADLKRFLEGQGVRVK